MAADHVPALPVLIGVKADRIAAAPVQIAAAQDQTVKALAQIAVAEDLSEAEDHGEPVLSVAEEDRVVRARTVAAAVRNLKGLRGDSVTLISEVFQLSRVFAVDLPVDRHFLHYGAAARALAQLVQVAPFFRAYQCSPLAPRYRRMEIANAHLEVYARQSGDCL